MFISIDFESGGADTNCPLSLGVVLANGMMDIVAEVEYYLEPNDKIYHVRASALECNGIDLVNMPNRISYKECGQALYALLSSHRNGRYVLVGKGVGGDLRLLWDNILAEKTWYQFVDYSDLELGTIVQFLKLTGKLPNDLNNSLKDIYRYCFGMELDGLHGALVDARATLRVVQHLREYNER